MKIQIEMKCEKNPLTGNWLCWIPKTSQAYYYKTKKSAFEFTAKVNKVIANGDLFLNEQGILTLKKTSKRKQP